MQDVPRRAPLEPRASLLISLFVAALLVFSLYVAAFGLSLFLPIELE